MTITWPHICWSAQPEASKMQTSSSVLPDDLSENPCKFWLFQPNESLHSVCLPHCLLSSPRKLPKDTIFHNNFAAHMSQLPLKNRVDDPSVEAIVLHLLLCTMVICSGTSTLHSAPRSCAPTLPLSGPPITEKVPAQCGRLSMPGTEPSSKFCTKSNQILTKPTCTFFSHWQYHWVS